MSENGNNDVRRYQKAEEKYLAFQLLREQGMTQEQAGKLLGYKPKTCVSIERKIRERGEKLSLLSESRIRRAHRVVDKLMAGKTFGTIESVKDSTALRAAETVLDRAEPKIHEQQAPTFSFTQVNLNLARPESQDCIEIPARVDNPQTPELPSHDIPENDPEMVGL